MGKRHFGHNHDLNKKSDALGRIFLRMHEFENIVRKLTFQMRETRALLSVLLAVKDIFIKRGIITDVEIKEEITKYLTDPSQKDSKGCDADNVSLKLVDENDNGLRKTKSNISPNTGD